MITIEELSHASIILDNIFTNKRMKSKPISGIYELSCVIRDIIPLHTIL